MIDDLLPGEASVGGRGNGAACLKGCEQFFKPEYAKARSCGVGCQDAADRWRHWHANQE